MASSPARLRVGLLLLVCLAAAALLPGESRYLQVSEQSKRSRARMQLRPALRAAWGDSSPFLLRVRPFDLLVALVCLSVCLSILQVRDLDADDDDEAFVARLNAELLKKRELDDDDDTAEGQRPLLYRRALRECLAAPGLRGRAKEETRNESHSEAHGDGTGRDRDRDRDAPPHAAASGAALLLLLVARTRAKGP